MKRINLNETWRLCLSMWRWIAKEKKKDNTASVESLKKEWLRTHGFETDSVTNDCFFCQYSNTHKTEFKSNARGCSTCPGTKIDPDFYCMDRDYNYEEYPIAFYNKLRSLNRKRLKN